MAATSPPAHLVKETEAQYSENSEALTRVPSVSVPGALGD